MPNKIIEKIKKEHIKMKPKWQFVLKSILLVVLSLITLSLLLFTISYVMFRPFPWILFLFSIAFIALLEFLINRYAASYRRPVIYSLLVIVSLVFVMGMLINRARFHDRIEQRNLPGVERFYKKFPKPIRKNHEINKCLRCSNK